MKIKANYISKYIRSRRVALGMSQEALKDKLGWKGKNTQYISNVELRKCSFPVADLCKLSAALQVDRRELIKLMVDDYRDSLISQVESEVIKDIQFKSEKI
jgi:transcriptional regulator with XRE-family HTH domain